MIFISLLLKLSLTEVTLDLHQFVTDDTDHVVIETKSDNDIFASLIEIEDADDVHSDSDDDNTVLTSYHQTRMTDFD